jgi:ornithine carbamoyltransferase
MIAPDEIGLGRRESVADAARALSRYVQGIMARVFAHEHLLELAHQGSVPVINGLSDAQHPCQALADALTILDRFGSLAGRRIAYIGDANNVAYSLAQIAAHTGAHVTLASPSDYTLPMDRYLKVMKIARHTGATLEAIDDPREAVRSADVVYTDTWVSMGQEAETMRRLRDLEAYAVNAALMAHAPAHAIVMHCLPAHRGQEITDEVMDGPQSVVFDQAENRLHAQKAVLATLLAAP